MEWAAGIASEEGSLMQFSFEVFKAMNENMAIFFLGEVQETRTRGLFTDSRQHSSVTRIVV